MSAAAFPPLAEVLGRNGLAGVPEQPFPNDGWSGASMTTLRRGRDRFVLKRDSLARDWIARATLDGPILREAWFAAHGPTLPAPIRTPYLGVGMDGDEFGLLMPDLTGVLFDWNAAVTPLQLDRVLEALATVHAHPWGRALEDGADRWTPWRERLTLICRPSLERAGPAHDAVADRLLPGWDAWDRLATPAARALVDRLATDPQPLLDSLADEPATLLHGDLKLANAGIAADGAVDVVDWQMVMVAPIAVDLGWFLVANVNALPLPPDAVLDRYRAAVGAAGIRTDRTDDLAILVGLLLRGWRKGADAAAGLTLASGVGAAEDLAWWCDRAVEAAARIL
ncbi:MAG TPA: phosphotransferase [Candidatus Limnocylindrales bacterium]|nr:phosphotransferase [Candidatus Limnocylindrales bacterium]